MAQRDQAREDLVGIRALLRDVRSGPDDVLIGRQAAVIKPSVTLMKLQCLAPTGALDAILRWAESLRGRRGRTTQDVTLVGVDSQWEELLLHREPERIRRRA